MPIFEIYSVRKNSPAEKAGLRVGDIILKINNKYTNRLNIQSITNLFQSEHGKLINITIERNGEKLNYEFHIEKIL
jgi:C-terminal processing protease CtpA/Prc